MFSLTAPETDQKTTCWGQGVQPSFLTISKVKVAPTNAESTGSSALPLHYVDQEEQDLDSLETRSHPFKTNSHVAGPSKAKLSLILTITISSSLANT